MKLRKILTLVDAMEDFREDDKEISGNKKKDNVRNMKNVITPDGTEILLYQTQDGSIRIETRMQDETVWLTQEQMSLLFDKAKSTVNEHIKNIYREKELEQSMTMRKFGNSEFSTKHLICYNVMYTRVES